MKLVTRDNMGRRCCVLKFNKPSGIIRFKTPKTIKMKKSTFALSGVAICLGVLMLIF